MAVDFPVHGPGLESRRKAQVPRALRQSVRRRGRALYPASITRLADGPSASFSNGKEFALSKCLPRRSQRWQCPLRLEAPTPTGLVI